MPQSNSEEEHIMKNTSYAKRAPVMAVPTKATFFNLDGTIDHSYTFDMDDDTSRVRFAIDCRRAYARGVKIIAEAL
jgi:hypothetical protein